MIRFFRLFFHSFSFFLWPLLVQQSKSSPNSYYTDIFLSSLHFWMPGHNEQSTEEKKKINRKWMFHSGMHAKMKKYIHSVCLFVHSLHGSTFMLNVIWWWFSVRFFFCSLHSFLNNVYNASRKWCSHKNYHHCFIYYFSFLQIPCRAHIFHPLMLLSFIWSIVLFSRPLLSMAFRNLCFSKQRNERENKKTESPSLQAFQIWAHNKFASSQFFLYLSLSLSLPVRRSFLSVSTYQRCNLR